MVFLVVDFFAADFFAVDFFAVDFLAVDFLAVDFLAVDFLAVDFLAAVFFAVDFLAAVFFAVDAGAVDGVASAVVPVVALVAGGVMGEGVCITGESIACHSGDAAGSVIRRHTYQPPTATPPSTATLKSRRMARTLTAARRWRQRIPQP